MQPGVCGAPEPQNPSAFVAHPTISSSPVNHSPEAADLLGAYSALGPDSTAPATPMTDDHHSSDEDNRVHTVKLDGLRVPNAGRYLGKSSATGIVRKALEMRHALLPEHDKGLSLRGYVWKKPIVSTPLQRTNQ